ncbi:MAG TPA: hypothetical protein ENK23_03795 [Sorangium sp.]|nr:hypothetical protein [Sorangium sp.]
MFDDTDRSRLENTAPVYCLLDDLGFRTTKSVWPIKGNRRPLIPGATCEDANYRAWTLKLQARGFEIGFHNATFHSSVRAQTHRALVTFRQIYGHDPYVGANHATNEEGLYWGRHRLSGRRALLYSALHGFRGRHFFRGHIPGDKFFWGDLCHERIHYYRNFVFHDINSLKQCPMMPYHDAHRPFVRQWFASSEGADVNSYCDMLCEANQDRLEAEGGLCIMFTHFGKGFYQHGQLDKRFVTLMTRLAKKGGWRAPTGAVLDHVRQHRGEHTITASERTALERRWLLDKVTAARR